MNFAMRESRVLRKLRAGEVVTSFKLNLSDIRAAELVARFGFDVLWTCMEHVPNDWSTIEAQIAAAKVYDVDVVCRVARGSYSDYVRPLEMDATGIMVPHVMSEKDAVSVVSMTKFPPVGRRAVDGGNTDGGFCNVPFLTYLETANRERFTVLQIEDPEALDQLDAIAAVDGYEILLFGPGDFSCALGVPGQTDHPEVRRAREMVVQAAHRHGKFAGTVGSPANRQELIDMGFVFLNVGADVVGLSGYCAEVASACGLVEANTPASQSGGALR